MDRFSSDSVPRLSLIRNRAYDENTGRWTQEDPIGIVGGLNLYQFNGNNPVSNSDPFTEAATNKAATGGVNVQPFARR